MDETLRLWGRNIASLRATRKPDGSPRPSKDDPGMGQADLGALLDPPVTQATVSRWESGRMEPRRHYKAQIADRLGADVSTVFPMVRSAA